MHPLKLGSNVLYKGSWARVTAYDKEGEYGERVHLVRRDGTQIITTLGLDPGFVVPMPDIEWTTWRDARKIVHQMNPDASTLHTICRLPTIDHAYPFPKYDFEAVTCIECVARLGDGR